MGTLRAPREFRITFDHFGDHFPSCLAICGDISSSRLTICSDCLASFLAIKCHLKAHKSTSTLGVRRSKCRTLILDSDIVSRHGLLLASTAGTTKLPLKSSLASCSDMHGDLNVAGLMRKCFVILVLADLCCCPVPHGFCLLKALVHDRQMYFCSKADHACVAVPVIGVRASG